MKYKLRIATEDPYCYIEAEVDGDHSDAVSEYTRLRHLAIGGAGLGAKEFAQIVYEYVKTGSIVNGGNEYGEYSVGQKAFINEITKLIRARNK